MKKFFTIVALMGTLLTALFLILTIFEINFFSGIKFSIMVTVAIVGVASYFCLTALNMRNKNKVLSNISFGLIAVSTVLVLIGVWHSYVNSSGELTGGFVKTTLSFSLVSLLFIFIVSTSLKLNRKMIAVQVICDTILALFIGIVLLLIHGIVIEIPIILISVILAIVSFIVVKVLSNKVPTAEAPVAEVSDGYVKISKKEYDDLILKAKLLEELLKNK